MQVLGAGLNLPMNVSQEDLAQMISGKLMDNGRQLRNVQLVGGERKLKLRNEDGVFLDLDSGDSSEEHLEEEESEEASQPLEDHSREAFERLTAERDDLRAQLSGQQEEVQCQKEHYTQLRRLSCEQLEEFDKTLEERMLKLGRFSREYSS